MSATEFFYTRGLRVQVVLAACVAISPRTNRNRNTQQILVFAGSKRATQLQEMLSEFIFLWNEQDILCIFCVYGVYVVKYILLGTIG